MLRTGLEGAVEKTAALSPGVAGALRGAAIWGGLGAGIGALTPEEGQSRLQSALHRGALGATYGGVFGGLRGASNAARTQARAQQQRTYAQEPPPPPSGNGPFNRAWEPPFGGSDPFSQARSRAYQRNSGTRTPPPRASAAPRPEPAIHDVAPFLRDVSSKADAKAAFRRAARAKHPDMGGSTAAMQELNDQWERAQAHPAYAKLAMQYMCGQVEAARLFGVSF